MKIAEVAFHIAYVRHIWGTSHGKRCQTFNCDLWMERHHGLEYGNVFDLMYDASSPRGVDIIKLSTIQYWILQKRPRIQSSEYTP